MAESPFDFDWLAAHAAATPAAPFLGSPATQWLDYATVHARVKALAAGLYALGVRPESRVAVSLPHAPVAAIATLAVHSLGAVAVELDRERSEASLAAALEQTKPLLALVLGRDARKWASPSLPQLPVLVLHPTRDAKLAGLFGARLQGWLTEGGETDVTGPAAPDVRRDAEALAQVVFTSGTTAAPRGVMLSHASYAANSASILAALPIDASSRAMLVLPLFHAFGKSVLVSHLRAGASVWLDDRFVYPRTVLEELARQRCTHFAGVPLTFELLKGHAGLLSGLDLSSLTTLLQAGGALLPATARWV
ncbi:MAG: acyl--CoA ligase, partial [Myxococcaceae bacterium]|nr:acyl--CoA ligase [Myxococcaceae bacterium]